MEARTHQTTAEFQAAAGPLLAADPVRHTIALTAVAGEHPEALLVTLHDNGTLIGAVIQTAPYPLIVSAMPAEVAEFTAKAVHQIQPDLPSASGPLSSVEPFVAAWTSLTGAKAERRFALRLFELGELKPPIVDGRARQATEADLPLITKWRGLFMEETGHAANRDSGEESARRSMLPGNINIFWEVDGEPVALAGARGPISGMVRVAPVYTPPELRGHGYASAVTAAVSQWALDQGTEHTLLYTDLSNPVTNRIYPRIGYRPLEDSAEYSFITVET